MIFEVCTNENSYYVQAVSVLEAISIVLEQEDATDLSIRAVKYVKNLSRCSMRLKWRR